MPTAAPPLPALGTHFYVVAPTLARERLRGAIVEFQGADDEKWECLYNGKLRVLFAPAELRPVPALQKNDWVKVLPRVQTHRKYWGEEYPVSRLEGAIVWVLDDDNTELELALHEVEACQRTDLVVGDAKRTQRRLELENQARIGWRETCIALAQLRDERLWEDATDSDGRTYGSFADYCRGVLGLERTQSYDRALAGSVLASLTGVPEDHVPQSVTALVELNRVPEPDRPAVLSAIADAGRTPTREAIREAASPDLPSIAPDRLDPLETTPNPCPTDAAPRSPEPDHEATVREWLTRALSLIGVERVLDILEELSPEAFE